VVLLEWRFHREESATEKLKHGYPAEGLFHMGPDALQDASSRRKAPLKQASSSS